MEENEDETERHQKFAVRVYMLLVVSYIIFADTKTNGYHINLNRFLAGLE
jgi:hypothetical protein